jgi:2TM domain-containing protein
MTTTRDRDDFEGIDINGPWGGIRVGSGGVRVGAFDDDDWGSDDSEVRRIRRRVRRKLDFYKNVGFFAMIVGGLALLDWATGGGWWVQWVAIIWGGILALQFMGTFAAPALWGREAEERMVRREVERQRGRVHVAKPEERPPE